MDSKKKLPVKKVGKKQFKNYALLDGVSVSDMTREQLEASVSQLQQEVEKETEERNYFQMERDRIQLFWEVTKHQLEEKDAMVRLKDSELDEARLTHLAEIKLYEQKMKHLMFECQQDIHKKMKEKIGEKLMADEEHQNHISYYTNEVNKLKDEILKLQLEHEDIILNQRLKHGEEICSLHDKYQKEMDDVKKKEVTEIENIRNVLIQDKDKCIQEIQDQKDLHIEHLVETHKELFHKMKNFYNDIIKNDILLIKSLKTQSKEQETEVNFYREKVKKVTSKNEALEKEIKDFKQVLDKRKENIECDINQNWE